MNKKYAVTIKHNNTKHGLAVIATSPYLAKVKAVRKFILAMRITRHSSVTTIGAPVLLLNN
jgi:hypothetical protein